MTVTIKQQLLVPTMGDLSYARKVVNLLDADKIVAYLTLNHTSGLTAVNFNSPGNGDGTVTGATWNQRKTLLDESSLSFDGVNDKLDASPLTYLNGRLDPTEFTIMWWWYQTTAQQAGGNMMLWRCLDAVAGNNFFVRHNSGVATTLRRFTTNSVLRDKYTTWAADQWNHGAISYSDNTKSNRIRDYVNGAKDGTDQAVGAAWGGSGFNTWLHGIDESSNNDYDGELSHILVVNGEITESVINQVYTLGGGT